MILSGEKVAFLEPQEVIWPQESGGWYDIAECHLEYPDSIAPFHDIGGFSADATTFDGTLFRFPLRNATSELSKKLYTIEKLHGLLSALKKEAKLLLLFLRSVDTIEVFEIGAQGERSEVFRVTIVERDVVYRARREFRAKLEAASHEQRYEISRNIPLKTNFHVQVEDNKAVPATQGSHWLLVSRVGSSNVEVLKAAAEQCAFPWVGVALELSDSRTASPTSSGRTFCFLPMPEEASCNLPVHVNGTFGVDKDVYLNLIYRLAYLDHLYPQVQVQF